MAEKATMMWGLSHLFLTVFFFNFSNYMVVPAITDVTMTALCPGEDECSLVIYLTGVHQALIGMGSLVMMPIIGNFSDHYGRKLLITFPMILAIFPSVILAYSREKEFVYAYYAFKTLTSMACEGTVICLAHAYLADNVAAQRRPSAFGILSGISSCSFVFGSLCTRFLPSPAYVFQVSAAISMVSVLYMRILLPESNMESTVIAATSKEETGNECLLENRRPLRTPPSLHDSISLLRSSWTFSQAAIVSFFSMLAKLGLLCALMYYLKAEFQFDTEQYADFLIIDGVAGIISQMFVMPMLSRVLNEEKLLAIGLAVSCVHILLLAVAWSSWVVYFASTLQILAVFAEPSLRSIVSKLVGPTEQVIFHIWLTSIIALWSVQSIPGKAQGCITGICSFAGIIAPFVFTPLTALFLSDSAPFQFPGFSLFCAALTMMIAFIQSIMIKVAPAPPPVTISDSKTNEYESLEP